MNAILMATNPSSKLKASHAHVPALFCYPNTNVAPKDPGLKLLNHVDLGMHFTSRMRRSEPIVMVVV